MNTAASSIFAFPARRCGWIDDQSGYSYSFSWWRNHLKPWHWSVIAHENVNTFANARPMIAITDDFGDLVRVPA